MLRPHILKSWMSQYMHRTAVFFVCPSLSITVFYATYIIFLVSAFVDSFVINLVLKESFSLILHFSWNFWFSTDSVFHASKDSLPYFFSPCQICVYKYPSNLRFFLTFFMLFLWHFFYFLHFSSPFLGPKLMFSPFPSFLVIFRIFF